LAKWFSNINRERIRLRFKANNLVKLFRTDITSFRYWVAHIPAVDKHLGKEMRVLSTNLLVRISQEDTTVLREVIRRLPEQLAKVGLVNRHRMLSILEYLIEENVQTLSLFLKYLPDMIERYNDEQLISYISIALGLFGESPMKAGAYLRGETTISQRINQEIVGGLCFAEIEKNMTFYARAHCGEDVEVRSGGRSAFTDGRHIYLPDRIEEETIVARQIYQVLTARNAGYIEFGTLDLDLQRISGNWVSEKEDELEIERMFRSFPNSVLARDLFFLFENYRIEQALRREYPGVAQSMDILQEKWRPKVVLRSNSNDLEKTIYYLQHKIWSAVFEYELSSSLQEVVSCALYYLEGLSEPQATVQDSAAALLLVFGRFYSLLLFNNDKEMLRQQGAAQSSSDNLPDVKQHYKPLPRSKGSLKIDAMSDVDRQKEVRAKKLQEQMKKNGVELSLKEARGKTKSNYEETSNFLDRMPGASGPLREDGKLHNEQKLAEKIPGKLMEDMKLLPNSWCYPEWDYNIEETKPDWTQVLEFRIEHSSLLFFNGVMAKYSMQIKQVRRVFEALRPDEFRRYRGMDDGDELDFERVINARVAQLAGRQSSSQFYTRKIRKKRDTAVAFLLDMSSSTNELANEESKCIIDVEKEALVVISEAVDAIGDRFAIYGFSGYGRDQVAFYIAKDIDESWDDVTRARIGKMSWKMENRDGAAIRHCTAKMANWTEKNRVMILLSDGKPLDCGCSQYSDTYAQQDTKMALRDAKRIGVQPFCITVDPYGQDYLQEMYGNAGYIVIDRIEMLPSIISKVYRRLTL
jgi:nitric oxide reductase NorD protein